MANPSQPNHARTFRGHNHNVRTYFAGVESLAREARQSTDPRVAQLALAVLQHQGRDFPEIGHEPFNASPADIERAWEGK